VKQKEFFKIPDKEGFELCNNLCRAGHKRQMGTLQTEIFQRINK
jgi:hypothetical protein